MGLVRAKAQPSVPTEADALAQRRQIARALGQTAGAEGELGRLLAEEIDPTVREALFLALVAQASPAAAQVLVASLSAEDAALRNGALASLGAIPGPATAVLEQLLASESPDLRIFGALLAGDLPLPGIELTLFALLQIETEVNVCNALLETLLVLSQPLPEVLSRDLAQRFRTEPFTQYLLSETAGLAVSGAEDWA